MSYTPQFNDYVVWERPNHPIEGWVYFADKSYITIEYKVVPKHPEDLPYGTYHQNDRVLIICYPESWHQLRYIKSRNSVYEKEEEDSMEMVGKGTRRESIQV